MAVVSFDCFIGNERSDNQAAMTLRSKSVLEIKKKNF